MNCVVSLLTRVILTAAFVIVTATVPVTVVETRRQCSHWCMSTNVIVASTLTMTHVVEGSDVKSHAANITKTIRPNMVCHDATMG